jgi:hypothetical protein
MTEGNVVAAPEPVMSGTFALYERPDGSMILSYRTDKGIEGKRVFPAAMVRMGMKMAERTVRKESKGAVT